MTDTFAYVGLSPSAPAHSVLCRRDPVVAAELEQALFCVAVRGLFVPGDLPGMAIHNKWKRYGMLVWTCTRGAEYVGCVRDAPIRGAHSSGASRDALYVASATSRVAPANQEKRCVQDAPYTTGHAHETQSGSGRRSTRSSLPACPIIRSIAHLDHGPSDGYGGLQVPSSQSRLSDCRWAAIHA